MGAGRSGIPGAIRWKSDCAGGTAMTNQQTQLRILWRREKQSADNIVMSPAGAKAAAKAEFAGPHRQSSSIKQPVAVRVKGP